MPTASALADTLSAYRASASPIWIAFSGGLDSTVLAALCAKIRTADSAWQFGLLHINHQLQPEARAWADHAEAQARRWGFVCRVESVECQAQGQGLEAAARAARYAVFERYVAEGGLLLMAHHADDQAETVLLRLFRGTGVQGAAGMPPMRALGSGCLLRPLLPYTRSSLQRYAQAHGLDWVEDPSNQRDTFDRNYLRQRVLPLIEARWPQARAKLGQFADLARELEQSESPPPLTQAESLALSPLFAQPLGVQKRWLRQWLAYQGLSMPSEKHLLEILRQAQAREDADLCLPLQAHQIRRYRGQLYCLKPSEVTVLEQTLRWSEPREPLLYRQQRFVWPEALPLPPPTAVVELRPRRGGERLRIAANAHQSLKKMMQQRAVPPWQRAAYPLLYVNDELWAVLGLCLAYHPKE